MEGIRKCIGFTKKGGFIFIGLYHKYGRYPFLDYFKKLMAEGLGQEELFEKYKDLDDRHLDQIQSRSWFLDQVLHPYETQHTLKEVMNIFNDNGVELVSTSINNFCEISDMELLYEQEKDLYRIGIEHLNKGEYYPGFFYVLGRKGYI